MLNKPQICLEFSLQWPTITVDIVKWGSIFPSSEMLYFTGDPYLGSLLYSVYSKHERYGLAVIPDTFSITALPSSSSILTYANSVSLQLLAISESYANYLSQVRAGSVVFLVGLGSFVCWKFWDYWSNEHNHLSEDDRRSPRDPKRKFKLSTNLKANFSSWMEEEFVDNFDEYTDPSLIQGKYFGPDIGETECKKISLSTSEANISVGAAKPGILRPPRLSFTEDDAGSLTSDADEEDPRRMKPARIRRIKRRHRRSSVNRNDVRNCSHRDGDFVVRERLLDTSIYTNVYHRFHPYEHDIPRGVVDVSSSETSPRVGAPRRSEASQNLWRSHLDLFQQRCRGDGSETPDWDQSSAMRSSPFTPPHIPRQPFEKYSETLDSRLQPDGEEKRSSVEPNSRGDPSSIEDVLEKMRSMSRGSSCSRDNNAPIRSSEGQPMLREDSVFSHLSDLNSSDCSDLSLELSRITESFAAETHKGAISFLDIEDELNSLKSSMHEMDREYERYASRPNPYLLKTTYSDNVSLDSDDIVSDNVPFSFKINGEIADNSLSRMNFSDLDTTLNSSEKSKKLRKFRSRSSHSSDTLHEEWISWKRSRSSRRGSSTETSSKLSQDDHPSLEWDNSGCLKQYEEEKVESALAEPDPFKFLPDHASLELDLEAELQSPLDLKSPKLSAKSFFRGGSLYSPMTPCADPIPINNRQFSPLSSLPFPFVQQTHISSLEARPPCRTRSLDPPSTLDLKHNFGFINNDSLTTSVDSAIHTGPASGSGSSTPSHLFSQSLMRYEMFRSVVNNFQANSVTDFRVFERNCKCTMLNILEPLTESSLNETNDEDELASTPNNRYSCLANRSQPGKCNPCPKCRHILTRMELRNRSSSEAIVKRGDSFDSLTSEDIFGKNSKSQTSSIEVEDSTAAIKCDFANETEDNRLSKRDSAICMSFSSAYDE